MSAPESSGRRRPVLPGPLVGLAGVLALFLVLLLRSDKLGLFLSPGNLQVLVHAKVYVAVGALGMLLVIISGGIDLSVGSVAALVSVVTMFVYRWLYANGAGVGAASAAAVAAGVLTGGVCGCANGLVITGLRVSPFVATLGMMSLARGLAYAISLRPLEFPDGGRPGWLRLFQEAGHSVAFFDLGFWLMIALAIGVALLLHRTVLGRYAYAIGSNESAARLCGVAVERRKVQLYTVAGLLTGVTGVILFTHTASGDPGGAKELELFVIAAVVIGGARLSGGVGTVTGTLLGALILAVVENGVSVVNVPVEVQYVLIGLIIIQNTALSGWRRRE